MATINDLHNEWMTTLNTLGAQKQALEAERKPLQKELDSYDQQAPAGLWGKLKHQMAKNVGLSPLRDKIGKIDTRLGNAAYGITSKAKETYNTLANVALGRPECAALRDMDARQDRTTELLSAASKDVTATLEKCRASYAAEELDTYAESGLTNIRSYQATHAARQSIKATQAVLLKTKQELAGLDLDSAGVGDLSTSFSHEASMYDLNNPLKPDSERINFWNMQEMQTAINSLTTVKTQLDNGLRTIETAQRTLMGRAIGVLRGIDPAADALAASITPHLPTELTSSMQRRFSGPPPKP